MVAARKHGTIISYDLNYRDSLWKSIGGKAKATEVNRELASYVDVMIGNEEDFTAALGFEIEGVGEDLGELDTASFRKMIETAVRDLSQLQSRRHHAAPRQDRHRQRLGRHLLLRRRSSTKPAPCPTSKSSTA